LFPAAPALAEADIACIGLPKTRAETIRALARAVIEGRIAFSAGTNVDEFQSRLRELPGIGDWTAQYVAMRALGDPDAFPAGDLGLRRGSSIDDPRELARHAERWRPWRAYAAMYLWQGTTEEVNFNEGERVAWTKPRRRLRSAAVA
jgi:3-methyladenine DNA glycosylase/8-oxoguanine DNA glycosylase